MNIQQKIQQVVKTIPVLHYMYNDWTTANIVLDEERTKFPLCLHILPVSGELYFKNANVRDKPRCVIAFLDLLPTVDDSGQYLAMSDRDGVDTLPLIENMKSLAVQFVHAVNQSGLFEPIEGDILYSVVYDKLDVGVTGVCVQLQLKELIGQCVLAI